MIVRAWGNRKTGKASCSYRKTSDLVAVQPQASFLVSLSIRFLTLSRGEKHKAENDFMKQGDQMCETPLQIIIFLT